MSTRNSWLLNQSSLNANKDSLANNLFSGIFSVGILEMPFAVMVITVLLNKSPLFFEFSPKKFLLL